MTTITAVDLFCGAGGTSTGLIQAAQQLGYDLKLTAINHWDVAIATHSANHPWAEHRCESLDNVDPRKLFPDGHLDLLVASPECTHHSNARGGKPMSNQSRASAWHILRWAEALYIENILVENVKEFMNWGPLDKNSRPIQKLKGQTFLAFINGLKSLGYDVDYRVINAANYGDATTRERLFIMARRDKAIKWPEITHSKENTFGFLAKTRRWKPARDIIDWSIPGQSIAQRKKPLSPNTMRRIEAGIKKFGGAPFLAEYHSSTGGNERVRSIHEPLPTQDTSNRFAICEPFIFACNHGKDTTRSYSIQNPMPTITSVDAWGLASPFLVNYNGTGCAHSVEDPLDTVTGKDRFGLAMPVSDGNVVVDVMFRMLTPKELAAAMSFPENYVFTGARDDQVKQIGNAVAVKTAQALTTALLS